MLSVIKIFRKKTPVIIKVQTGRRDIQIGPVSRLVRSCSPSARASGPAHLTSSGSVGVRTDLSANYDPLNTR